MFTSHNYTKSFLSLLHKHKSSKNTTPPLPLLVEVLDGAVNLDYQELDIIFYYDTDTGLNFEERHQILKKEIFDNFMWVFYENGVVVRFCNVDEFNLTDRDEIWLLCVKSGLGFDQVELEKKRKMIVYEIYENSCEVKKIKKLIGNGKKLKKSCDSDKKEKIIEIEKKQECVEEIVENKPEQEEIKNVNKITKNNILRFVTLKPKEEKNEHKKFTAINDKYSVIDTVRKSEDIVNKCKMTFIKFFDRIRPPIYDKFTEKYAKKNTIARFLANVDYDYDSDIEWEDDENADILDESSESEIIEEEEDLGFIETEGENIEVVKKASGPSVGTPTLEIKSYYDYRDFLNHPIVWYDKIPSELEDDFVAMVIEKDYSYAYLVEFSRSNFIKLQAVQKKARILKKSRITENIKI